LILLNFIRRQSPNYPARYIVFRQIGRKSRAHALAFRVHKGKLTAHQTMQLEDFEELLRSK